MIYTSPPISTTTLIANLKTDGLSVNDENFAEDFLTNVSYFRFNAYLRPFEDVNGSIRFKPNATFDKAVALYLFDAEFRNLLFSAIQLVEISLRSKIINQFSLAHGAFGFIDSTMAIDKHNILKTSVLQNASYLVLKMTLYRSITTNMDVKTFHLRGNC